MLPRQKEFITRFWDRERCVDLEPTLIPQLKERGLKSLRVMATVAVIAIVLLVVKSSLSALKPPELCVLLAE